jgi:hypothetical protein
MNQTKTAQQVAAYIRAVVKREVGQIETVGRKISEDYHWYTKDGGRTNAWRYKYYVLYPGKENMDRAYEAYRIITDMAPRIANLFGYKLNCHFTNYHSGNPNSNHTSLIYNVTPIK